MNLAASEFFESIERTVEAAEPDKRLGAFAIMAREAVNLIGKGSIVKADAVDRLYAIAAGYGLVDKHGVEQVQAVLASAVENPFERIPDEAPGKPTKFKLVRFKNLKVDGKPRYLVKGLIPSSGMVVIWGPPKCGKSFLTFDLAMHIALGRQYRDRRVRQGGVVYLALEGGEGFKARAEAYRVANPDMPADPPFALVSSAVNLIADHAALIESIREQSKGAPAVVVVDTLNRSLNGSESKDEDMARYIRAADTIRDAFGCVVIIVHHSGIETSRPRGHTSLTGATDCQVKVERDASGNIIASVEWMKDGPDGAVIGSRLETVEVGKDEDGDPVTSCVIVPVDAVEAPKSERKARLPKAAAIALRALRKATSEVGEVPPASNHIPLGVKAVTVDQYRDYAYRLGISSSAEPRARQQAFRRGWDYLVGAGLASAWDPYVWEASP